MPQLQSVLVVRRLAHLLPRGQSSWPDLPEMRLLTSLSMPRLHGVPMSGGEQQLREEYLR